LGEAENAVWGCEGGVGNLFIRDEREGEMVGGGWGNDRIVKIESDIGLCEMRGGSMVNEK
jgi:hypothetical protein